MRRSDGRALALVLLLVFLCAGLGGCRRESSATSSSLASSTSSTSSTSLVASTTVPVSGQDVLSRAVAWIEAAPTQVTFGLYHVTYGPSAKVAMLTVSPNPEGEPLFSGTGWWSGDTDYWQEGQGSTKHVTPEMAVSMRMATYPGAESGVSYLVMVRFLLDPHRLLTLSKVTDSSRQRDGNIRSMSTKDEGLDAGISSYVFARTSKAPTLPTGWDDLDQVTLRAARDQGWRANVADAAPYVDFPVYSLGDSYKGRVVRSVYVQVGVDAMVEYDVPQDPGSIASTARRPGMKVPDGYLLLEYAASNVPESEKRFVANKTLVKTAGQGNGAYTVYKTAKGLPGRSILAKKGETYISIDRIAEMATADATAELLAAAEALQRSQP